VISKPDLGVHQKYAQTACADEQADDTGVIPRVYRAAPLQRQDEADGGWDRKSCSQQVELEDPLPDAELVRLVRSGHTK